VKLLARGVVRPVPLELHSIASASRSTETSRLVYTVPAMPKISRLKLPAVEAAKEPLGLRIARLRRERGYTPARPAAACQAKAQPHA